ncbi:hypothetical protein [Nonomuraea typhae]|uniref:Uncharacterized protein n=1 Tax=Nonomuraea typhae TaxID=2603600 RepID=A0ABW7Z2P9_9ACTN
MTADWADLDDEAWRVYGGLHRMLVRLAGQVPDDLLAHARSLLGSGEFDALPDIVTAAAAELGVSLTEGEMRLLRDIVTALGDDQPPTGADQVTVAEATPRTGHVFTPRPPGLDEDGDLTDDLVVDALSLHDGLVVVRRAWRSGVGRGRRVYLAEVDPGVRAWDLAAEGQAELAAMDDDAPQMEVFWTGDDLPPYHRAALAGSAVLWER